MIDMNESLTEIKGFLLDNKLFSGLFGLTLVIWCIAWGVLGMIISIALIFAFLSGWFAGSSNEIGHHIQFLEELSGKINNKYGQDTVKTKN